MTKCKHVNIGIVEENIQLRKWYEQSGTVHTGTKKFDDEPPHTRDFSCELGDFSCIL